MVGEKTIIPYIYINRKCSTVRIRPWGATNTDRGQKTRVTHPGHHEKSSGPDPGDRIFLSACTPQKAHQREHNRREGIRGTCAVMHPSHAVSFSCTNKTLVKSATLSRVFTLLLKKSCLSFEQFFSLPRDQNVLQPWVRFNI